VGFVVLATVSLAE